MMEFEKQSQIMEMKDEVIQDTSMFKRKLYLKKSFIVHTEVIC